ncbi:glutaminase A [Alkalicoccus halolimnae]|uniref:Glutaminase n=1 Tax=Alkalicoccus halolimnae TaxID=1667239 RepID=A0A5C7FFC4_9BACI|nr:glutaminase A [Alkalicoccus halolimnae]TXF84665.1 glutaminase A [Alkalicoccus halolimnae]
MNVKNLEEILNRNRSYTNQGETANYIPELAYANPQQLGITVCTPRGEVISVGDCEVEFTMQSISKVVNLIVAVLDNGPEQVFSKVGMESSGEPFNSVAELETKAENKPLNPLINAGAIAVSSMIKGRDVEEQFQRVCTFLSKITGKENITLNERIYESEKLTGDRNRSLAYFMKSTGVIDTNVEEALDLYFRLCSISVTCSDLAKIGLFLSTGGKIQGEILHKNMPKAVQIALSIMLTAGLYNESGETMMKAGIPAKSGVSGGIMAAPPNEMGIGIIGPAINSKGNSAAGVKILEDLSSEYNLHVFKKKPV